jgi:hypothetical protein
MRLETEIMPAPGADISRYHGRGQGVRRRNKEKGTIMKKPHVTIVLSGGWVTHVYSTLQPNEIDVRILDFDAAKNYSLVAAENLEKKLSHVKKTCRLVGSEMDIGRNQ